MTQTKHLEQPIELSDDLTAELEAGRKVAAAFSTFDAAEVAKWDGSEEKALASDSDGIDLPDQAEHGKAA
jgi:hypothetical protein